MPINNEDDVRALWQSQRDTAIRLTPEQLRSRAEQFESQTRRRYVRDQVSFSLVAIAFAYAVVALDGLLVRLGSAMLLAWALYGMYGLHRFGAAFPIPVGASSEACAAFHRRQLVRQRDIVLSWPLGLGLGAPGFVLVALGYPLGPRALPWPFAIALLGLAAFTYIGTVIYGKILAGRWQSEIDEIDSFKG